MHRSQLKHVLFSVFLIILAFFAMPIPSAKAAGETITSSEFGGDWNNPGTWVGGVVPDAIDDSVVIATLDGAVVSLGSATTVKGTLTINAGAELSTEGRALTLEGDLVNNGLLNGDADIIIAGTAPTQNIGTFSTSETVSMTKTSGTATFTGNISGADLIINGAGGTLNLGSGRSHVFTGDWTRTAGILEGGSSTIRIEGSVNGTGGTFTPGTSTFIYKSSSSQSIAAVTYHNLKLQSGGAKTALGDIVTNGYLRVESGAKFTLGAFNLTVTGYTSITGTLTLSSPIGTKTFTGLVTVNPGGTWKNDAAGNADIHFRGGLTNNGDAFNAGTGTYYFETNDQSLGGFSALTIPNVNIEAGRTLTNNNSGGFTVSTTLVGGSITQGAGGSLIFAMADASNTLVALDASAAGNTVNYGYAGAQAVREIQYHSLALSGSGVKSLPAGVTHLTGNFSLSGTASAAPSANLDVDGNLSISNGATLTVGAFDFNVDGATSITGTSSAVNGKLTYSSATGAKSHGGAVVIGANGIWDNFGNSAIIFQNGLSFSGKTFTGGSGFYTFQTSASQAIGGTAAFTIPNMTVSAGVDLTNNNTGGLTVSTELNGAGALTQGASAILNLNMPAAKFTLATLTANASGNTVNYGGGTQTIRPITYHHLTLGGTSLKAITGLSTINGNFTLSGTAVAATDSHLVIGGNLSISASGAELRVGSVDITVNGTTNVTGTLTHESELGVKTYVGLVSISGTWSNSGDSDITFRGGLDGTITSANAGPTATYTFDTTAAQIVDGSVSVVNLNVGSGVTLTNEGSVTISGNLGGAGTWAQGVSGALTLTGTADVATFNASAASNTVKYTGGVQSVRGATYHNLELGGGAVKTMPAGLTNVNGNLTLSTSGTNVVLAANLTVGGNISIASGTIFDVSASNYSIGVSGKFTGTGTFTPQSGTVTFQGVASQEINNGASAPFYNMVVNNPAGVTLSKDLTVNNALTFTSGKVSTGTKFLIFGTGGTISGASPSAYVNGNLRKAFPISVSPQAFTFEIGDATVYAPVNMTINNVSTSGTITASTTAGEHPNIATVIGMLENKDVNRYWTLTPTTIVFTNYDATFNFAAGDLDVGANTANFVVKNYASSPAGWNSTITGALTGTSTQATSIPFTTPTNIYKFAVGESDSTAPTITGVTSSTANGSYGTGDTISGIAVTFSEAVDVTGTPQLTLNTGAVLNYSSGTGTTTLTFADYTVQAGQNTSDLDASSLSLNGGSILDIANNPATLAPAGLLAASKAIVIDTTAPVTQIDSHPSDPTNDTSAAFTYSANETSTFQCRMDGGNFAACASPYTLAAGEHTFQVRATDAAGNVDATPASYTWTIDTTGPTVVSSARASANPTDRFTVQYTVTFSEAVTGVDKTDFSLTLSGVTGASVQTVTGSGTTYTVTVRTGSGNGTIKLNVLDNNTIKDVVLNPQDGAFTSGEMYTVNKTMTFQSISGSDGWTLESTATSNKGGTFNSNASTFRVGDDAAKKQYRGLLHFNTAALPDNAVITSVTIKFLKAASGSSGNTATLGALLVDMTKPSFGSAALTKTDFEAAAGKPSTFNVFTIVSKWYSATMKSTGLSYLNRTGTTQFRIRFTKGDDGDGNADFLAFYSGNAGSASRPQLIVNYYVP